MDRYRYILYKLYTEIILFMTVVALLYVKLGSKLKKQNMIYEAIYIIGVCVMRIIENILIVPYYNFAIFMIAKMLKKMIKLRRNKVLKLKIYKIIKKIRRQLYKIQYYLLRKNVEKCKYEYGLNKQTRDIPQLIVSLTTFPNRFEEIDLCIKSILRQTYKPDKIIIWLGSDTSLEVAEKILGKYKKYGVEYKIDNENNYYSHKKYLYVFKEYKDSIIVTLDDDLIYPKNTIKSLIKKYKKYPNNIIARRVHKITWSGRKINQYNKWYFECFWIRKPSNQLCATTGAGTLFPSRTYKDEDLDYETIKKYALTADDIWLKMMATKENIKIVWAGNFLQMPPEVNPDKTNALSNVNVKENRNDEYIKKILNDFNLDYNNFK